MSDSNTAEQVSRPEPIPQTYELQLMNMSDRNFIGHMRAVESERPYTALKGCLHATAARVLLHDSFGNDPYCLRGPKRAKVGRR